LKCPPPPFPQLISSAWYTWLQEETLSDDKPGMKIVGDSLIFLLLICIFVKWSCNAFLLMFIFSQPSQWDDPFQWIYSKCLSNPMWGQICVAQIWHTLCSKSCPSCLHTSVFSWNMNPIMISREKNRHAGFEYDSAKVLFDCKFSCSLYS
jgi:hypothetical protein